MVNASEALSLILHTVQPHGAVTISLERSWGLFLAENIISNENVPAFDNTAMDGFAVRSEDTTQAPAILTIVGEIPAGQLAERRLQPGEAMSIMTGAKIPDGCDAVIQIEWTEQIDDESIKTLRPVNAGHNIRKKGNDIQQGSVVLQKGQSIRSQEIGTLASLGKQFVTVIRPPSVAILTTGHELVEINKPPGDGKIRNSNFYALQSLVQELGCSTHNLGICSDTREELTKKIAEGLQYDILITSGGVSVGKYDLVMETLKELGVEIQLWKVNIKPGMPFLFGMHGATPVFGLPGNPVSTFITFLQFVRPAVLRMKGELHYAPLTMQARLTETITKHDAKRHFIRGIVENNNGELQVRTTGTQISNVLTSLTKANCLIIIPEERGTVNADEVVTIELL